MNPKAKVILFPQSTNKGYPLKIRIIENRKPSYIGLKFYLTESQKLKYWNDNKKELRKSYPFYDEVMKQRNKELTKIGFEIKNDEVETKQEPINTASFTQYYKNYMESLRIQSQIGLLHKTTTVLYQIELFCSETGRPSEILFSDLNIDFINDFKQHLVKKKILPISQRGYLEKIRGVINKAIREDKYNPKRHPFLGFEFMKIDTTPKCLLPQQFDFLKAAMMVITVRMNLKTGEKLPPYPWELKKVGLKFLFQYYSYGMRVSDLLLLRWANIYESGKRLKYKMFKTKNEMDIVLNNDLLDILFEFLDKETRISIITQSKSEGGTHRFKVDGVVIAVNKKNEWYDLIRQHLYLLSAHSEKRNNRIFSKIPIELNIEDDVKKVLSKISTYTCVYNKELKNLAQTLSKDSSPPFHLSSHMARHTFAYMALLSGQSVYYISQALNHKSIKTTENYLRGFNKRSLDGRFYKPDLSAADKKAIDDKLSELMKNSDYDKKKKIMDLFSLSSD